MDERPSIRLFLGTALETDRPIALSADQAHYLRTVMRRRVGDQVALFNGLDGEWLGRITLLERDRAAVLAVRCTADQDQSSDLWLLFAPVKRARLDFIAQRATELGVARIQPVWTARTTVTRINQARLAANAVEAAEQCGRRTVPDIAAPIALPAMLAEWPGERILVVCDPRAANRPQAVLPALRGRPAAVLIGPEGGFDDDEWNRLAVCSFVHGVSLGGLVLRADTAAVAALALYQSFAGAW